MRTITRIKELSLLPLNWEKLDRSKILIVGASGLIGSAFAHTLLTNPNLKCEIYVMGRSFDRLKTIFGEYIGNENFHIIEHDIVNPLSCAENFDYIVDCASNADPANFNQKPVETILTNVLGVQNLLDYSKTHGLKRFLFVSSGEVYGETGGENCNEEADGYIDILNPRGCYPLSKRLSENLCISYVDEYNLDVVIARPCHIFGPNFLDTDDRAYAQFLRKAAHGEDIELNSPGLLKRSWCYIIDCVSGLLYILLNGASSNAYNISDIAMTIRDFAEAVAIGAGVKVKFNIPKDLNPPIISQGILDSTKLRSLGWKPCGDIILNIKECISDMTSIDK
nr:NAD-dependent epimerase/dehydratase family protein [uncultured Duncaniella sp.]